MKTDNAEIDLDIFKDMELTIEHQLIKKNQRPTSNLDSKILTLYAKGMTTGDIADTFKKNVMCTNQDIADY